jgi:hypothetical protein
MGSPRESLMVIVRKPARGISIVSSESHCPAGTSTRASTNPYMRGMSRSSIGHDLEQGSENSPLESETAVTRMKERYCSAAGSFFSWQ